MRTVDSNGNGELSTEEFTSFLAKMMSASRPASRRARLR